MFGRYVLQILRGHVFSLHFLISLLKFSRDDTFLILSEITSCARVYSLIKRLWPRCFLVLDLKASLRKRFCFKSQGFFASKVTGSFYGYRFIPLWWRQTMQKFGDFLCQTFFEFFWCTVFSSIISNISWNEWAWLSSINLWARSEREQNIHIKGH